MVPTDVGVSEGANTESKANRGALYTFIIQNLLILLTLIGVILGFAIGFGIRPHHPSQDAMLWIGIPGEIFMRMLKFCILPLIVSSVITGTSSLDPKSNSKIGSVALLYFALTNFGGTLFGAAIYFLVRPGADVVVTDVIIENKETNLQTQDLFMDLIRNLFPDNMVTACFQKTQTQYIAESVVRNVSGSNITVEHLVRSHGVASSMNVLGLIIVSTVFGIATAQVGEVGKPFVEFFKASSLIIITILRWVVWFTPIGVASLIASSVCAVEDIESTFKSLGMFVVAVSVCMLLMVCVIYPGIYMIIIRKNPARFLLTAVRPMLTAFAPPSSAVAMPDMMNVCENKHGVDARISRFVVPFATVLNRNGSCGFIYISAIFLCKLENVDLDISDYLFIGVLTAVSSFAIPSVPSASIITIIIVLSSSNIRTTNVGLLMALEWLLDRLRTCANVISECLSAIITDKFCQSSLHQRDKQTDTLDKEQSIDGEPVVISTISS